MKDIQIYCCDFWNGFDIKTSFIYQVLSEKYNVIVCDKIINRKDIDLVIYSCFGNQHLHINGIKKLYYSGENDFPNFHQCDYAITHNSVEFDRHIRVPLWVFYHYENKCPKFENNPEVLPNMFDRKFCADVISNNTDSWSLRQKLISKISEYHEVDHGGAINNNVGGPVKDKFEFLNNYKFSIAAENSDVDGYVTEKIYEAFCANTIPIYLGNKKVIEDFNSEAFINVNDFKTYSELLSYVKRINENADSYIYMITRPRLAKNDLLEQYKNKLSDFLINIIEHGQIYNHKYGRIGIMNANSINFAPNTYI